MTPRELRTLLILGGLVTLMIVMFRCLRETTPSRGQNEKTNHSQPAPKRRSQR